MTSGAIAAMLSTILYGRRFFPYYVYNIIGGLDEEGIHFSAAVRVVESFDRVLVVTIAIFHVL